MPCASGRPGRGGSRRVRDRAAPAESPLWTMPNVLVSPHSASTSDRENGRLTELFCDNLRRFLKGDPLKNVLDLERLY